MDNQKFLREIRPILEKNEGIAFAFGKVYNEQGEKLYEYPPEEENDLVYSLIKDGLIEIVDDSNMQFLTRSKIFKKD